VPDGNMKDIVSEMARSVTGLWMLTVIDSDSMVLATWQSPENRVSPEALGGFMQILTNSVSIFKASPVGFSNFEDIIFSTTVLHQVIKPIAEASCYIVASAPRSVPLGMIRSMLNSYAPGLEKSLPGRAPAPPTPRRDGMGTIIP
jgi:predicted regulator of Ras-like GTPase activity (Roadblock/LC7/MglB family)